METYSFRLRRGEDLLLALKRLTVEKGIEAAVPVACVGCVSSWRMRCADGHTICAGEERAEITSLTGTLSQHGAHLHIALAREDLNVIGGHLVEGCIVNTTAEVVLLALDGQVFSRVFDPETGYRELEITSRDG